MTVFDFFKVKKNLIFWPNFFGLRNGREIRSRDYLFLEWSH